MRTVKNQTEGSLRSGFHYNPDRHYIKVQIPDSFWDGGGAQCPTTPEQFLDIVDDQTGDFAYRIEAMGSDGNGRLVTNSRRLALLSCSKEYSDRVRIEQESRSRENMQLRSAPLELATGQEIPESLKSSDPVDLKTAFKKADAAKQAQEALMRTPDAQ